MGIVVNTAAGIIERARSISGTYLMGGAGPHQWDCSGFVGYCVGANFGERYFATPSQGDWLRTHGFKDVRNKVNFTNGAGMRAGDILVYNKPGTTGEGANGHTEIYWGDGLTLGARGGEGHPVGLFNPGGHLTYVSRNPYQQCWRPKNLAIIKWTPG